jgi:serine/threonine protein kinase
MTIQEMFEREDIYNILEVTLEEYYQKVHNKKVDVKISKKHFFRKLLIYPRLGIVTPLFPSWAVIKRTYISFDVQNNLPKKLFAWTYITLCFLTFGLLADASMKLSDYSVVNRDTVIIPSNRKIRIYEYAKGYVDSILKVGFNDFYFNNEIEVRKHSKYDYILGLMDYGSRWYREKLLKGRCLVRCSGEEYQKYLKQTIDDLEIFYEEFRTDVYVQEYAKSLSLDYEKLISEITEKKHIKCAKKLRFVLKKVCEVCYRSNETVPLTLTHGDLQTGNIYVDEENNQLYIIDWETVKKKSIWYDAATVMCSTRRANKFSAMINSRCDKSVQNKLFVFDKKSTKDINLVAAVLVLEEMGFFLDEIVDLPGEMGSEIIERFEHEIDQIDWATFDE